MANDILLLRDTDSLLLRGTDRLALRVSEVGNPPVNTVLPAVTGSTVVGGTLTTTDGTWTNSPDDYAYEWERSGDGSTGWESVPETNNTYVTDDPADIGYYFRSKVTATNADGSASAYSTPVGPITDVAPTFKPHWALNRSRILGSGIR